MDDALCGAETLEVAKEVQHQLIAILKSAGMKLHKICGNPSELSQFINEIYDFSRPNETKTLGVSWNPERDTFSFKVDVISSDSYTKRSVLSTIARLFNPLVLVGPIVSKAKMFMQKLWRLSIDWIETLPNKVYYEWHQLLIRLESLNSINIERRVVIKNPSSIEINDFFMRPSVATELQCIENQKIIREGL
ncbi:uncharacterized protein TNCV_776381 [Trichonephila clavipes]|nr:uncharacterized protein TNCV_776381 [Trichonephila clavipes]